MAPWPGIRQEAPPDREDSMSRRADIIARARRCAEQGDYESVLVGGQQEGHQPAHDLGVELGPKAQPRRRPVGLGLQPGLGAAASY